MIANWGIKPAPVSKAWICWTYWKPQTVLVTLNSSFWFQSIKPISCWLHSPNFPPHLTEEHIEDLKASPLIMLLSLFKTIQAAMLSVDLQWSLFTRQHHLSNRKTHPTICDSRTEQYKTKIQKLCKMAFFLKKWILTVYSILWKYLSLYKQAQWIFLSLFIFTQPVVPSCCHWCRCVCSGRSSVRSVIDERQPARSLVLHPTAVPLHPRVSSHFHLHLLLPLISVHLKTPGMVTLENSTVHCVNWGWTFTTESNVWLW